jgi:site-specific recombinase XerD/uncharacterized coiled-coil protein SlyX
MSELGNRSEATREKYKAFLLRFCEWCRKNPDELVKQRKQDLMSKDPIEQRKIESYLKGFIASLEKDGYAISTQQVAYAAVRNFFEMHYQSLRMRRGDYPSGESLGSRAATKEDIKKLLNKNSKRMKALMLLLKDTGLRASDVVALNYGDVSEGLESDKQFIPLFLITKKNRITAKTFLGPEAVDSIKEYISERKEGTRRLPPEKVSFESPLFRTRTPKVKRISRSGLSSTITYHAQRLGVNSQFSAHSFRKYFQTQLESAGVNPNWIDQMIGHRLINSRDAYSHPSDKQLLVSYRKAYNHIRVFGERNFENRITGLESQISDKDIIIESLVTNGSKKEKQIMELKNQIEKLRTELDRAIVTIKLEDDDTKYAKKRFYKILDKYLDDPERRERFIQILEQSMKD